MASASTEKVPFSMAARTALTLLASKSPVERDVWSSARAAVETVTGTPAVDTAAAPLAAPSSKSDDHRPTLIHSSTDYPAIIHTDANNLSRSACRHGLPCGDDCIARALGNHLDLGACAKELGGPHHGLAQCLAGHQLARGDLPDPHFRVGHHGCR